MAVDLGQPDEVHLGLVGNAIEVGEGRLNPVGQAGSYRRLALGFVVFDLAGATGFIKEAASPVRPKKRATT